MKPARDAGFTLLEMLVALIVFGLVMAGLAQTFRFGLTAFAIGARNTASPENLAALDAALTRMIAGAVPGTLTGERSQLAFTTRLPAGAGFSGLADIAILDQPGGTLILRYSPHPAGIPLEPPPPPKTEILAQGVAQLRAAYLQPQAGAAPGWINHWSDPSLPLLIRIHLEPADGRNWPDLIAAPTASAD